MKKRRAHSSIRMNLSDAEYQMIDRLAKKYDCSHAELVRRFIFQRLEDEFSIKVEGPRTKGMGYHG